MIDDAAPVAPSTPTAPPSQPAPGKPSAPEAGLHAEAPRVLRELFDAAVRRASPARILAGQLPSPPRGRTVVIGAGKASAAMAQALEAAWPAHAPLSGVVVTRRGHIPSVDPVSLNRPRIHLLEAAHPVPDEHGQQAVHAITAAVRHLGPDDLVIALMSGGGSALLPAPLPGWTLAHKQDLHRQLLLSGASINDMNVVRRHLSTLKGGRLARLCRPARVVTLAISDVPGDRFEDIASGPTVPDPSRCEDVLEIVDRFRIALPAPLLAQLRLGTLETCKPGDADFARDQARMLVTPSAALDAAATRARELGLTCHVLSDNLEGEAKDVGIVHAGIARSITQRAQPFSRPCVLLSGGETTVTLPSSRALGGSGGRCSELLLAAAIHLAGEPGVWMLAGDTDGIDGVGEAAGAVVHPDTLRRAQRLGLAPKAMLANHESGRFFRELGDALLTGPTHTNVNDFRAILIT